MSLRQVFSPDRILIHLESEDKEEVFEELVNAYAVSVPGSDRQAIISLLEKREQKMSTGIQRGIAVPHVHMAGVDGIKGVIGISHDGVEYGALDGQPVYLFFMLVISESQAGLYLALLKELAQLLKNADFYRTLMEQKTPEDVYSCLCSFETSDTFDL